MLPLWADIAILAALPVIVLAAVWIWGDGGPDNTTVHHSGDDPPDTSGDGDDLLLAA